MEPKLMFTVRELAQRLGCSTRQVYRLADAGRIPRPVNLGRLVRWPSAAIDAWMMDGCPDARRGQ